MIKLIRVLAGPGAGARGPDREVRAVGRAGAGDPRHAPPAPDRARDGQDQGRARGPDGAHQGAARDPRRGGAPVRPDQGGAARDQGDLRRRAPQRDHRRRGRGRPRGPDRRGADGDLDHALRLHQAAAALDLPQAEARRRRRDRDGDQGGRLHRAPAHLLDARLPAVLHQPRQGLPAEGLRAARGRAHRQGPRAGQPAAAARGRARARRDPDARLLRAQVRRVRHAQGPDQEDRADRLQHADPRGRDHRDQAARRRLSWSTCAARAARTTSSWSRARATRRASTSRGCGRWAATRPACAA